MQEGPQRGDVGGGAWLCHDHRKQVRRGHEALDGRAWLGARRSRQSGGAGAPRQVRTSISCSMPASAPRPWRFSTFASRVSGTRSPKQAWPEPDFQPEMPLEPRLQDSSIQAASMRRRHHFRPQPWSAFDRSRRGRDLSGAGLPGRVRRWLLRSGRCDASRLWSCDRSSARVGQAGHPPSCQERICRQ